MGEFYLTYSQTHSAIEEPNLFEEQAAVCLFRCDVTLSHPGTALNQAPVLDVQLKTCFSVSPAALKKVFSESNEVQKLLDEDFIVLNLVVSYRTP